MHSSLSQEISAKDTAAINLLRSEACKPNEVASKLPEKSPAYVFYSFPTPPPPKPVRPVTSPNAPAQARNTFQATAGGVRSVPASNAPRIDEEGKEGEEGAEPSESTPAEETEEEGKEDQDEERNVEEKKETPDITGLNIVDEPAQAPARSPSPEAASKGRVVFIYWCPSGSPVKYRMVYSTTVRGIQQDALDKVGMEVVGKIETSDKSDVAESAIRDAVPNKSKSSSLPSMGAPRMFGAPAPAGRFGSPAPAAAPAARSPASNPTSPPIFGAPRPIRTGSSLSTGSGGASSAAASPATGDHDDDSDSSARIQSAFNAFGPRVGGGGGGFARPRGPGRR